MTTNDQQPSVVSLTLAEWRIGMMALLSWAIPFLVSIPFFSPDGGLVVPEPLFKSIMVVVGTLTGALLLVWAFRRVKPNIATGLTIGLYWLAVNWVLDALVLLPLSGDSFGEWFADIGLRYLSIPIIAAAIGAVADRRGNAL